MRNIVGCKNPMWGKKHTEETKNKIRLKALGRPRSRQAIESQRKKMIGRKYSLQHRLNMSISLLGNKRNLGRSHTLETKQKIGMAHLGEKSHWWNGGSSKKRYSYNWTKLFRYSIKKRDGFTCKICGESKQPGQLSAHHIDYNKMNMEPENLITLCHSCHSKTNYKRKLWLEFFMNLKKGE